MKNLILFLFLISPFFSQAQDNLVVEYSEKIKIEIPDEVKQRMKERGLQMNIPESRTVSQQLFISGTESQYKLKPEAEEDEFEGRGGGNGFRFRMMRGGGNNLFYKNTKAKEKVVQQEIFGKEFLIEDSLTEFKWKITGLQMKVLDYICMEATTINGKDTVKAYFTPQIPISNGPSDYGNLPGLILKLDINDGERVITATDVNTEAKIDTFVKPSKGKKVTQAEFDVIREEKIAEMREMYGEGRVRMIAH